MTDPSGPKSQSEREREKREQRLAQNLRDNLRRRKAAVRKQRGKKDGDTGH